MNQSDFHKKIVCLKELTEKKMYSLVYNIYFSLKRLDKRIDSSIIKRFIRWFVGYIEAYFNLYVKNSYEKNPSKKSGVTKVKREKKIIVSLTSYPKRISTTWIAVETIMRQAIKADEIILWLAKEQFNSLNDVPEQLLQQRERGLTIRFCDDLRSHKKYFYAMQEFPNDIIILVDDDMFYPYDTIGKLIKLHNRFPEDVCCMTTQVIQPSFESMPSLWRNPYWNEKIEHSDMVQVFTGSGSLYVPNSINKDAFDKELLLKLCPYADDMWLTYMARKNNTYISSLKKWRAFPVMIYETSKDSLWYVNTEAGKNDEQWKKLWEYYSEESK